MQTARTQELVARASELRGQGARLADIASALGICPSYASELLRDPTGEHRRHRRRHPPPEPPRPGEGDAEETARRVSGHMGFAVGRPAVEKAARRRAITSRKGPGGALLFEFERVVSEIDAGRWRPHRSRDEADKPLRGQGWVTETCANARCTRDEHGRAAKRTIRRSHHERLVDPWTCSDDCTTAVGGKQRRPERKPCGCAGCPSKIRVTRHQAKTGTGPKRCDECARAGRRTVAQLEAARAALDRSRSSKAARQHQKELGARNGDEVKRNRVIVRDETGKRRAMPRRKGAPQEGRREALERGRREWSARRLAEIGTELLRDCTPSNRDVATRLGRDVYHVMCVRWQLEQAGEIPPRNGRPQPRPPDRYIPRRHEWSATVAEEVRSAPHRKRQENSASVEAARGLADRAEQLHERGLEVAEIAAELHIDARTAKSYLDDRGRSEQSPGRREAKQRRRILKHLEGTGADTRRNLQRALRLSARELAARLCELPIEAYQVDQRCVRLVSAKSANPSVSHACVRLVSTKSADPSVAA